MTFRCALRFEPDKAKGPGYGLILASCPGFSAAPNTLLYMIKDPSNSMSLGPNGWQPGDAHLVPDAVAPSGEILSLSVGKPGSAVPASELLNLKERPKSYKSLILNIIFAILTVILLAGAGYFIYTRVLPKTDTTLEEKPAEVLKHEAADLPPGQEAPVKYAPDDIKGPKGLQVARDALKRKVEPDTAMALAQQLFAAADDVKAQDGAFLIADELAKKGNAQALLMLGDFYSPKQPQRGTIQKDTDMANDCYKKALAAGAAEAQQRLDALK